MKHEKFSQVSALRLAMAKGLMTQGLSGDSSLRVCVADFRIILRLHMGEVMRWLEQKFVNARYLTADVPTDSLLFGRVLLDTSEHNKIKLKDALDLLFEVFPGMSIWLKSSISVIKTADRSSSTGAFFYPGPMMMISGAELAYDRFALAGVMARRIALARLMRWKAPFAAFDVMRAHITALGWEVRLYDRLAVDERQVEATRRRIDRWAAILERWCKCRRLQQRQSGAGGDV